MDFFILVYALQQSDCPIKRFDPNLAVRGIKLDAQSGPLAGQHLATPDGYSSSVTQASRENRKENQIKIARMRSECDYLAGQIASYRPYGELSTKRFTALTANRTAEQSQAAGLSAWIWNFATFNSRLSDGRPSRKGRARRPGRPKKAPQNLDLFRLPVCKQFLGFSPT